MIPPFKKQTEKLSSYETTVILPAICDILSKRVGKGNVLSNIALRQALTLRHIECSAPRIRKIINHIRVNGLIKRLMATSKGYYISFSKDELIAYTKSLKKREEAIASIRKAIEEQTEEFF